MADTDSAQLWKELGKIQGTQDGHEKRLDQEHEDIKDLRSDIVGLRTDMAQGFKDSASTTAACIAELEKRIATIIGQHVAEIGAPGFDLGSALKKPQVIGPLSGGIGAVLVIVLQYLQGHQ